MYRIRLLLLIVFIQNSLVALDPSNLIGHLDLGEGFCTGILIGPKTVLTAAHCVLNQDPNSLLFTLKGSELAGADVKKAPAKQTVLHPTYWKSADGSAGGADLALVFLKNNAYGAEPKHYIDVATPESIAASDTLFSWGYGVSDAGEKEVRRKKPVKVKGVDSVMAKNGSTLKDIRLVLERGETGEIPCSGDSGGPILLQRQGEWYLVAINSRGGIRFHYSTRTGYERRLASKEFLCQKSNTFKSVIVSKYLDWINETRRKFE